MGPVMGPVIGGPALGSALGSAVSAAAVSNPTESSQQCFSDVLSKHPPEPVDRKIDRCVRREFQIDYQPVVSLTQGHLESLEALLHIRPDRQRIYSRQLLDLVYSTTWGDPIETWVMTQVCEQLSTWQTLWNDAQTHASPPIPVSLNLSAKQLRHPRFIAHCQAILTTYPIQPQTLQLEIPAALLRTPRDLTATLAALHPLGISFTIDDFTPSLHNTRVLAALPIDRVKISQSCLDFLSVRPNSHRLLTQILDQLDRLDIQVISKRIETPHQQALAQTLDRQLGQGFLFHPPISPQTATTLIEQTLAQRQERSLQQLATALQKLNRFAEQFLGPSLVRRYWQDACPKGAWFAPLLPRLLHDTLLPDQRLSLQQQRVCQVWIGNFTARLTPVIRRFHDQLASQSSLAAEEWRLLGLG